MHKLVSRLILAVVALTLVGSLVLCSVMYARRTRFDDVDGCVVVSDVVVTDRVMVHLAYTCTVGDATLTSDRVYEMNLPVTHNGELIFDAPHNYWLLGIILSCAGICIFVIALIALKYKKCGNGDDDGCDPIWV